MDNNNNNPTITQQDGGTNNGQCNSDNRSQINNKHSSYSLNTMKQEQQRENDYETTSIIPTTTTTIITPTYGSFGTPVTVTIPASIVYSQLASQHVFCIAFDQLILYNTQVMLPKNTTTVYNNNNNNNNNNCIILMCNAPNILDSYYTRPLLSASTSIPIYVCLLENNLTIQYWYVGHFTYICNHYPFNQASLSSSSLECQYLYNQHQLQQQYTMIRRAIEEVKEEDDLSPINNVISTPQTASPRLLTQPWPECSTVIVSSSSTPTLYHSPNLSSSYNSFDYSVISDTTEKRDKNGNASQEVNTTTCFFNNTRMMDLSFETELRSTLYTSLPQHYVNDNNGSKVKEESGRKTSGPCMDTDLLLLCDSSSPSHIPTTAKGHQLREFNNSNTKMMPMIVGVSTTPSLPVSTQQQRKQPMFNVTQQQQTNRRQQRQQKRTLLSDISKHDHPKRKRTKGMRSTKPRPNLLTDSGVTWQEYTPYPKIDQPLKLEFLSNFDTLSMNWTEEENLAHRRLVQFWRVATTSKMKICCDFCALSKDEYNNQERRGRFSASSDNNGAQVVVMSCITFKQNLWITSVDLIHLLEYIMRVTLNIEEKNRIRRNLEGFHPITVSKHEVETVDLYYHVMGFKAPFPRSIEKDFKIFDWHILPYALKKILVKYHRTFGLLETNEYVTAQQTTTVYDSNVLSKTNSTSPATMRRLPHSLPFPQQQHAWESHSNNSSNSSTSTLPESCQFGPALQDGFFFFEKPTGTEKASLFHSFVSL